MAMNTNNIKDFERIQTSIQKSRAEWEMVQSSPIRWTLTPGFGRA